jgi:hypothetical protein
MMNVLKYVLVWVIIVVIVNGMRCYASIVAQDNDDGMVCKWYHRKENTEKCP